MEVKEIDNLIRFHSDGLDQYRQFIAPSAQYLIERTIVALKELRQVEQKHEIGLPQNS